MGRALTGKGRAVAGAVLLDLAVSPLFAWDVFAADLRRELGIDDALLASVFSVGLVAFMVGVLIGGRLADAVPPRVLALITTAGTVAGLLGSAVATSVATLILAFGIVLGASTGLGYATAVRVAGTVQSGRGLALGLVVSAYAAGTAVLAPVAAALLASLGRAWTFVLLALALGLALAAAAGLVPGGTAHQHASRRDAHEPRRHPRGARRRALAGVQSRERPRPRGLRAGRPGGRHCRCVGASGDAAQRRQLPRRLVAGPLSDRVGRAAALHGNSALLLLACLPLAAGASGPVALTTLFLLGTQYGALSTLTPAATSDVVPGERFGATYGLVFTGWGVAGLLAPIAAAALAPGIGFDGVYRSFLLVAALAWACVAAYVRLARHHEEPAGTSSV